MNQCFSYYFCLTIKGSGSISLTNNPDADLGGAKTFRSYDPEPDADADTQHCLCIFNLCDFHLMANLAA